MAALTTNTTIKGDGLRFDVRSYKLTRVLDFSLVPLASGVSYEIGDLPPGFVPRNVAVIELVKPSATGNLVVALKSDSASLATRALGTATGLTVGQVTGKNLAGAGDVLAVTPAAAFVNGKVKIVVSGDLMADEMFDHADAQDGISPADAVKTNMMN